jgi:hypothetical protein
MGTLVFSIYSIISESLLIIYNQLLPVKWILPGAITFTLTFGATFRSMF